MYYWYPYSSDETMLLKHSSCNNYKAILRPFKDNKEVKNLFIAIYIQVLMKVCMRNSVKTVYAVKSAQWQTLEI